MAQQQVFSKKIKYLFASDSDLEAAQIALDIHYPHLRTSYCNALTGFILFVESTDSFIYDSLVESHMERCGGKKIID